MDTDKCSSMCPAKKGAYDPQHPAETRVEYFHIIIIYNIYIY